MNTSDEMFCVVIYLLKDAALEERNAVARVRSLQHTRAIPNCFIQFFYTMRKQPAELPSLGARKTVRTLLLYLTIIRREILRKSKATGNVLNAKNDDYSNKRERKKEKQKTNNASRASSRDRTRVCTRKSHLRVACTLPREHEKKKHHFKFATQSAARSRMFFTRVATPRSSNSHVSDEMSILLLSRANYKLFS